MSKLCKTIELSTLARTEGNLILKKNNRHSSEEHWKILSLYSKSIAYAPNESEELALAYGNRSYLLSHLKMFSFSIIDIDRALSITKSCVLKAKLMCRKISALKSMNQFVPQSIIDEVEKIIEENNLGKQDISNLKDLLKKALSQKTEIQYNNEREKANLPTIDANIELPSTSTAICMEYNNNFGRHYRANKNILPGEILIIEQGYAVVPKIEQLYIVCSVCVNLAWVGVPCSNCPCVFYCSEQCKQSAWNSYHKIECPILMQVFKDISHDKTVLMTLRILCSGLEECNGELDYLFNEFILARTGNDERLKGFENNILNSKSIRSIFSLTGLYGLDKNESPPSLQKLSFVLNTTFGNFEFPIIASNLNDLVMKIFNLSKTNSYMYQVHTNCKCDSSKEHKQNCLAFLASFIGACSSLVNHSCVPNVNRMFKDGKLIVLATRPIAKNEQIFDSYGPIFVNPTSERQDILRSKYCFTCNCIACKENWDISNIQNQSSKLLNYFGESLLSKIMQMIAIVKTNRKSLLIADIKRIIHECRLKTNLLYKSSTLLDVAGIHPIFMDFLVHLYEIYYGASAYIPED